MVLASLQNMFDLRTFSRLPRLEHGCAYRILPHFIHLLGRFGSDFGEGWVQTARVSCSIAAPPWVGAGAVGAIGEAVHGVGGGAGAPGAGREQQHS